MRSAEVRRTERAWLTRELTGGRRGLDAAWVALVLLNLVAIAAWPSWDTVPIHIISTGFAVLYGLRLWPADPVHWGLGIVIITTFAGIGLDLLPQQAVLAHGKAVAGRQRQRVLLEACHGHRCCNS